MASGSRGAPESPPASVARGWRSTPARESVVFVATMPDDARLDRHVHGLVERGGREVRRELHEERLARGALPEARDAGAQQRVELLALLELA